MPISFGNEMKKTSRIAIKEKLLHEINNIEQRIRDFPAPDASQTYCDGGNNSDDDFPTTIDTGPSVSELKKQQSMLKTCLQATQELVGLTVLQSSNTVMVTDPDIEGEPLVTEAGLWQEVSMEGRFDLVPFSMAFYVHQPDRKFAQPSYRCLNVTLIKKAHDRELASSLLKKQRRPSDALEVLRSYSNEIRSRRNTLAHLSDQYAENLHMEPLTDGGYMLKCANLLALSWRLQSKKTALAVFQHVMDIESEYIEESYLKIITQAHKQLSNPTITTDERTLLLSKIVATCLEAKGINPELYESMESSDQESIRHFEKRQYDEDIEGPVAKRKRDGNADQKTDEQIMAPPKSVPKKSKPKGKENIVENRKSAKRPHNDETNINDKKAKTVKASSNKEVNNDVTDKNQVDNKKSKTKVDLKTQNDDKVGDNENNTVEIGKNKKSTDKEPVKVNRNAKDLKNTKNKQASATTSEQDAVNEKNTVGKIQKGTDNTPSAEQDGGKKKAQNKKVTDMVEENPNRVDDEGKTKKKATTKPAKTEVAASKEILNKPTEKIIKNTTTKETNSQQNEKVVAVTKNSKTKESGIPKEKLVRKDDEQLKNTDAQQVVPVKKNVNSKTDRKENTNKNDNNVKTVGPRQSAKNDDPIQNDQPTTRKSDKISKSQQSQKQNENNSKKAVENTKNVKNAEKSSKSENTNTKTNNNKKSNTQNNKKGDADSEVKLKATNAKSAAAKNTENLPKSKPETSKDKKVVNEVQMTGKPPLKNIDAEANVQKPKVDANPKNLDKKTSNAKKVAENATKEPNTAKYNKIEAKKMKSTEHFGKENEVVKVKNSANKVKEHIAEFKPKSVANAKKNIQRKSGNFQNKMLLKNLPKMNPDLNKLTWKSSNKNVGANAVKNFNTGNTFKENGSASKISKIPQKIYSSTPDISLKRNALRISPRKLPSSFRSASDSNLKLKSIQKPTTGIPRLMKTLSKKK